MQNNRKVTVEVFRDTLTPEVSIDDAEKGLDQIRQHVGNLAVTRTTRRLKIANTPIDHVNAKTIRFPDTDANLNIVLTGRPLEQSEEKPGTSIAGQAFYDTRRRMNLFAVVSTATDLETSIVVAHEAAHLLNLKQRGKYHEEGHCTYPTCTMQAQHTGATLEDMLGQEMRELDARFNALLASHNLYSPLIHRPKYTREASFHAKEDFCSECSEQLGANAFYLMNLKEGKSIPPGML